MCGLGVADHVLVSPHAWGDWADRKFGMAGGHVQPLPHVPLPQAVVLLRTLAEHGLIDVVCYCRSFCEVETRVQVRRDNEHENVQQGM